jgi:hypothetical protein
VDAAPNGPYKQRLHPSLCHPAFIHAEGVPYNFNGLIIIICVTVIQIIAHQAFRVTPFD